MHKSPRFEWNGLRPKFGWLYNEAGMNRSEREGRIHYNSRGTPCRKEYLHGYSGHPIANFWADIPTALGAEHVGYPTQKPLALLERMIAASSNEGYVVLAQLAGCATTCVAAEHLGRQWVVIDLSPETAELVNIRPKNQMGDLWDARLVTLRDDIPQRTDIEKPINYRKQNHVLFGKQEDQCAGCRWTFPSRCSR